MRETAAMKPTAIYLVTNKINGKHYIGVTCKKPFSARWKQHLFVAKTGSNTYFHKAIRKYGEENFTFRIMETFTTYREGLAAEREAIAQVRPEYNSTDGGDGCEGFKHSDAAKKKMSEFRKGRPSGRKGFKHSIESRLQMSRSQKGKPGFWKGKKLPAHVSANLRRVHAEIWAGHVKPLRGPTRSYRRVVCLNDGRVFDKVGAAAKEYGVDASSIFDICMRTRVRKMVNGLVFRFFGDHYGGAQEAAQVRASLTETRKQRIADARKNIDLRKPVKCVSDGRIFPSIGDAANHYGLTLGQVSWSLKHGPKKPRKNSSCGGLVFEFANRREHAVQASSSRSGCGSGFAASLGVL